MSFRQVQIDNADREPPGGGGADIAPWVAEAQPARRHLAWQSVGWLVGGGIVVLVLAYFAFKDAVADSYEFGWLGWGVKGFAALVFVRVAIWALTIRQPGGYRLFIWQSATANAAGWVQTHASAAPIYAARQLANARQATLNNELAAPAAVEGEVIDDTAPLVPKLLPDEWLPRLDNEPHAIFAAKTKGGKSTTVKALLRGRVERGESVFVIDPHTSGWLDLPSVGGGADWSAVERAMGTILAEYQRRHQGRKDYMDQHGQECPHDFFPRLTIIFDEANETRKEINRRAIRGEKPWSDFTEVLGSGARKVGINVWLICQSALVKDLDLSTVMRRNFTIVALDHQTITELLESEDTNRARRQMILDAVRGLDFPAAAVFGGESFLLDRTGLDRVTPPQNARACAWAGWDYERSRPALRMVQAPQTDADRKQAAIEAQRQRVMRERWPVDAKRRLVTKLRREHPDWTADEIRYAAYLSNQDTLAELRNGHGGSGGVGA